MDQQTDPQHRQLIQIATFALLLTVGLAFLALPGWAGDGKEKSAAETNLAPDDAGYDPRAPRNQGIMPTLPPGYEQNEKTDKQDADKSLDPAATQIKGSPTIQPRIEQSASPAPEFRAPVEARPGVEPTATTQHREALRRREEIQRVEPVQPRAILYPRPH